MTPVVWLNFNPEAPSRGYWDQGMLEALTNGLLWKWCEYSHHETIPLDVDGAVVIIPGRQNVEYVTEINDALSTLLWVLIIISGDEENVFPSLQLQHPNMKLWLMTPQPRVVADHFLGSGVPPNMDTFLTETEKSLDYFFAGQVTHSRREMCINALKDIPNGEAISTPGFTQGLRQEEYWRKLGLAKVAPCPGGPLTPDSFRLYEALEAGCIPVADLSSGAGLDRDYWERIFGGEVFFPVLEDWNTFPELLPQLLSRWPHNANIITAAWQGYKRNLFYRLKDEVGALSKTPPEEDGITVLMPTSPITSHPDTFIIEETVASIRERLPLADIIIMVDGIRAEQVHRKSAYDEYVRRLMLLCEREWVNVLPLIMDEHLHQARMTLKALEAVKTSTILFVEHDTPLFGGHIPWDDLLNALDTGEVNVIRLHHEASVLSDHQYLMLDDEPQIICGAPLLRTVQWSQRPHLAKTSFYRMLLSTYFGSEARTMIEDLMYGVVETNWRESGVEGWSKFKLWMFSPPGNIKRSSHIDGRAGESKYSMVFAYDGETPEFAPFPGVIE